MSGDDNPAFATFAGRLQWAREQRGLDQAALGKLIGRTKKSVYRYENDGQMPNRETQKRLARVLKVSAAWLMHNRGQPFPLQEVEDYLLSSNAKGVTEVMAEALREMPWAKMGMAKPSQEDVHEARILLEHLMFRAAKRTDGDKNG